MTAHRKPPATAWKPGQSGNPAGRPPGVRNRSTLLALAALESELEQIARNVVAAALAGDMVACRVVLDKLIPPLKERPVSLELPAIHDAAGVAAAQDAILQAVASGELLPSEGTTLAAIVENRRRTLETQELEARIAALEKAPS